MNMSLVGIKDAKVSHVIEGGDPRLELHAFRRALGQFGTGVTVVTTRFDGANFGVTSNSFASVSLDPPLILWSIKKTSQSYEAFMQAESFVVNILSAGQFEISGHFAKSGGDKFAGLDWQPGIDGCPVLDGGVATLECKRWALNDGGDHTIIIGQVENFRRYDGEALLFSQGQYAQADVATIQSMKQAAEKPFETRDGYPEFFTTLLRNAYGAMWAKMEQARRDVGITHPQAGIIYALHLQPGLKPDSLASKLGFGLNSSEGELNSLLVRGLIVANPDGGLRLTADGEARLDEFLAQVRAMEKAETRVFSESDLGIVKRVLGHLLYS